MAFLLNRNSVARIECLHALVQLAVAKFGNDEAFTQNEIKFSKTELNVHKYCGLLKDSPIGIKYCPYKQNPLDDAGCSLTNGVEEDTTKSKEVSNTVNALHALGFVKREKRYIRVTSLGIKFAKASYGTEEMQGIIRQAVLNYGPVIGVLKQIIDNVDNDNVFLTSNIRVGYPNTAEAVLFHGYQVRVSSGSKEDSNIRTRSVILAWLTAAGFIRPAELPALQAGECAHCKYRDYLNLPHRGERRYILVNAPGFFKDNHAFVTEMPLDYKNLTKQTAALRENNQALVREATMLYENRINNRRFAILFFLNRAYENRTKVKYSDIITFFQLYKDWFVISDRDLGEIVQNELDISSMAGIPFRVEEADGEQFLIPITGVNMKELSQGAPMELINILQNMTL